MNDSEFYKGTTTAKNFSFQIKSDTILPDTEPCCRDESNFINKSGVFGTIQHILTQEMGITPALSQVMILFLF